MLREVLQSLLNVFDRFSVLDRVAEQVYEPDQRVLIHRVNVRQDS